MVVGKKIAADLGKKRTRLEEDTIAARWLVREPKDWDYDLGQPALSVGET